MPKKKRLHYQTGITPEGKPVISGVYKLYETIGLPLDVIFTCFRARNWVPDWNDFYLKALASGMEHTRIISKMEEAISDSFGKDWADEVISRLDKLYHKDSP